MYCTVYITAVKYLFIESVITLVKNCTSTPFINDSQRCFLLTIQHSKHSTHHEEMAGL